MSRLGELVAVGLATEGVVLGSLTTYKFGGPAEWFVTASSSDDVASSIDAALDDGVPYLILGRGSNLVISDAGFPGLVVRLGGQLATMSIDGEGVVTAGGAMPIRCPR